MDRRCADLAQPAGGLWYPLELRDERGLQVALGVLVLEIEELELPREVPITVRPDWVCEILSASNAHNDLVRKMRVYQRSGVPHYWVLDPEAETLTVYRWMAEGYLLVQTAAGRELVRPEPFGEVELSVRGLIEGDE